MLLCRCASSGFLWNISFVWFGIRNFEERRSWGLGFGEFGERDGASNTGTLVSTAIGGSCFDVLHLHLCIPRASFFSYRAPFEQMGGAELPFTRG